MILKFLKHYYIPDKIIGSKDSNMNYTFTYINDLKLSQDRVPNLKKIYNSNILITGATGLVCSAIVDFILVLNDTVNANIKVYLAARTKDKALQRFGNKLERTDIIFVEYNALEEIKWDYELDYIIHGASPANPSLYVKQPVETMLANIIGLKNILEYAVKKTVKRILFISSSEVYGNKDTSNSYKETDYGFVDIINPRACYPSAKRACETLSVAYHEEYGVNCVNVRLGHIYGPTAVRSDTRASSQFFYDVVDAHDIIMKSNGLQKRSYCYVVDCVSAIVTVLINGEVATAYNISNPSSVVTIRELAEMIALVSGQHVKYVNPTDVEVKGYNLMSNSSLDSHLLKGLGWNGYFDLQTGVKHTLQILKDE